MKYVWRNGAVGWKRVGALEKESLKKNCTYSWERRGWRMPSGEEKEDNESWRTGK
jgi:hypothetical protein